MSEDSKTCPKCSSPYAYPEMNLWICPECSHEWNDNIQEAVHLFKDANGIELQNGDSVSVIKELKLKGSQKIKSGTKVKNIRLLDDPVDGHDISCKIDGIGAVYLKCSIVKKL